MLLFSPKKETDFIFSNRTNLPVKSWARYALTAFVDSSNVLNAIGGSDSDGKFAPNIVRYDLDHRIFLPPVEPVGESNIDYPSSNFQSAVIVHSLQRVLIFGGKSNGYSDKIFSYPLQGGVWQKLETTGTAPSPRYGHSAVYSTVTDSMWVFGGYDNKTGACNDLHKFDVKSHEWTKVQVENKPSPRFAHSSFIFEKDGNEIMVVFGGCNDAGEANNQLYLLNLSDKTVSQWQTIANSTEDIPAPRYGMSGFFYEKYLYVFGGYNKKCEKVFGDMWNLDLNNFQWKKVLLKGALSPRYYHSFVTHNSKLYLLGGRYKDHSIAATIEEYNLITTTKFVLNIDTAIPSDCLLEIFSYLTEPKDLVNTMKVCKKFAKVARDEILWYKICKRTYLMSMIMARDSCKPVSYYESYIEWRYSLSQRTKEEIEKARVLMAEYCEKQLALEAKVNARKEELAKLLAKGGFGKGGGMMSLKCIVAGDHGVGKTSLLISYTTGTYPGEDIPTVFDNYSANVLFDNKLPINLGLWDTAGPEDYDRLRPLSYPQTDIFLCLFSVADPQSFYNLALKWIPEITHHCPNAPYIIVGNKCDLLDDPLIIAKLAKNHQTTIRFEQAKAMASALGAYGCYYTSAKTLVDVKDLMNEAIRAALTYPMAISQKNKNCLLQ